MNVEELARAKEDTIRFQTFESAFAWDALGNEILAKNGQRDRVTFTQEEALLLKDAVFTHNHTKGLEFPDSDPRSSGNSFSMDDVEFACFNNLAEMRVVTPKLRFALKRPESGWDGIFWLDVIKPVYDAAERQVKRILRQDIIAGTLSIADADARRWHEVLKRVAERLALDYRREEN